MGNHRGMISIINCIRNTKNKMRYCCLLKLRKLAPVGGGRILLVVVDTGKRIYTTMLLNWLSTIVHFDEDRTGGGFANWSSTQARCSTSSSQQDRVVALSLYLGSKNAFAKRTVKSVPPNE